MIPIYTKHDQSKLIIAGKLAKQSLEYVCASVKEGVTTNSLDEIFVKFIKEMGCNAPCKGFHGYPKSLCISVNDEVCHGIPSTRILKKGDIVSVDLVVEKEGYYADTCKTVTIGGVDASVEQLIDVTHNAMMEAIANLEIGMPFNTIGECIENFVKPFKFGIVKDYCGHGIGKQLHHSPQILHYHNPSQGKELIKEGMCFTIEPMITLGHFATTTDRDGWTVRTKDNSICAQFEHTIFMDKSGPIITTL